jgi:hypothetical protein
VRFSGDMCIYTKITLAKQGFVRVRITLRRGQASLAVAKKNDETRER